MTHDPYAAQTSGPKPRRKSKPKPPPVEEIETDPEVDDFEEEVSDETDPEVDSED